MTDFNPTSLFDRLNFEQRLAVDTLEGPVLVIAGPGTGKTEILASRIVNILTTTQTDPSSILCLTYTDAGTVAMRNRLLEYIGPTAHAVTIATFHSFCNQVIQEQGDYFGFRYRTAASDLDRYRIACSIIDDFPQGHPLTRSTGDLYYEASRLLTLFDIMKKEGWSPAWLSERVQQYIESLPTRDEYIYKRRTKQADGSHCMPGDVNRKKLAEEQHKMEQLQAAAACFDTYANLLGEQGLYDFADMILWCRQAFEEAPELRASYQERYLYLLVDELQDTSGAQFDILMQLADYWDAPNLFMVGDDDQSIYRFQGASVENLHAVSERYRSCMTAISLTQNYRSTQAILDAADSLIRHNEGRLDPDKQLLSATAASEGAGDRPQLLRYQSPWHEAVGTVERIGALLDGGVAPQDIAVIYRNHTQLKDLLPLLAQRDIPVQTRRKVNILNEPLILRLERLLSYLERELAVPHSAEQLLFEILHDPWFGISPLALAKVAFEIRHARVDGVERTWRVFLQTRHGDKGQPALFSRGDDDRLIAALQTLERLIHSAAAEPVVDLVHRVMTEMGLVAQMLSSNDRMWDLELLTSFYTLVRREAEKRHLTLSELLQLLRDHRRDKIPIEVERMSGNQNGVVCLTAHGSKGLEFEQVLLIGCQKSVWDTAGRSGTYRLPPTIFTKETGVELEEARRLFYVALTRAKRGLTVSYAVADMKGSAVEESQFISELRSSQTCDQLTIELTDEQIIAAGCELLLPSRVAVPESFIDHDLLNERLKSYSVSVSHVNAYLRCPVSFYFTTLLRIPTPPNAAMVFGSAVHYAIEQIFGQMKRHPQRLFPSVDAFTSAFVWYMRRYQDLLSETEYRRRYEYGLEILPLFYAEKKDGWRSDALVELPIRNVAIEGVPLNGKLDMVEPLGGEVRVIDFKTGSIQNISKKLKAPDLDRPTQADLLADGTFNADALGGDYWRQAVFYRILVENAPKHSWRMSEARFDFVEPDRVSGRFSSREVAVTPEEVRLVMDQIVYVYQRVMAHDFSPGCGKPECEWCAFLERYQGYRSGITGGSHG